MVWKLIKIDLEVTSEVFDLEVTLEVRTSKVILKLVMGFAVCELLLLYYWPKTAGCVHSSRKKDAQFSSQFPW